MQENAKVLLEKFAEGYTGKSEVAEFHVYAVIKNAKGEYVRADKGHASIPDPFGSGDEFFVAEVSFCLNPKGGFATFSHTFQLDLQSLIPELQKINPDLAKGLMSPKRIAAALNTCYHKVTDHLIDYNGTGDDYPKIADVLVQYYGTALSPIYDI
jgi:hypothetical protein